MQNEEQLSTRYQCETTKSAVERILAVLELADGEHVLVSDISGFKYPIKIVVAVENEVMTVITSYPLKKGRIK